jgi:MoxR-like ATPase
METVAVEDSVGRYMVEIASATRDHPHVLVGSSPRGSLALMLLSRARAALDGRDYVIPEDVKRVAKPALAHRLTLKPEVWLRRVDPGAVIDEVLAATPAPTSGALPTYGTTPQAGPRPRTTDNDAAYRR